MSCCAFHTSPESPVAHSPEVLTSQISAPCVQGLLLLLPALPCVTVYLMWCFGFLFFNETLKDSSCLAQPLRKVSNSYICLFYIKLYNVLCMFFSVRNKGGVGMREDSGRGDKSRPKHDDLRIKSHNEPLFMMT